MSVQETMWKFLRANGLPETSSAAIMGNVEQESSFDPNEYETGGDGFGLFQWSYDRRRQLEAYGTDLQHQLNFFWSELTGKDSSSTGGEYTWKDSTPTYLSYDDFMSGKGSVDQLTETFCVSWERAGTPMMQNRIKAANKYYSQFSGTKPDSANSQSENITIEATNYQVIANSQKYGDVLFGRRYRVTVSDAQGNGIDVSQLRCTFNIVKTIQMQPNTGEIVIYNLNAKTENAIMMSGARVTVEAGYEGSQFGLIFDGDILQTIREKEDSTTYKLTILALDSDRALNFEIANYSIVKGQTARSILDHIVSASENPVFLGSISDKLEGQTLTRGKVLFGKASDYIRQIAKTYGLQCYMDDGKLNLIHMDDLPEGEAFELNPESGLIGTPQQTDFGISGQCLLNPQIKLNTLIHMDNSLVRAKQINVNGNNTVPGATSTNSDIKQTNSLVRNAIIAEAKRLCDDPNVRYSEDENLRGKTVDGITYYDCSIFVKHCYETAGLDLLDITTNQWQQVKAKGLYNIDIQAAMAGDLVFWFDGDVCYHVAIYGGNNDVYAARSKNKSADEQVSYGPIYGEYKIGRPESLIRADGGELPSASGQSTTDNSAQGTFRGLDKDGIYRTISLNFVGDTRGNDWFINFTSIDQLGGTIPIVSN
ncbi:phage protein [Clostridium beijerinckii]|nr:phage tail tip lysozyme [Clostridium beijerinckii]